MTEQQFVYWLQGFSELNINPPTALQWQSIREHLATVFKKVTPDVAPAPPPVIDLSKNKKLADFVKRAEEQHVKWPHSPPPGIWQPYYLGKPGELIC
jgi:hypothetical protein